MTPVIRWHAQFTSLDFGFYLRLQGRAVGPQFRRRAEAPGKDPAQRCTITLFLGGVFWLFFPNLSAIIEQISLRVFSAADSIGFAPQRELGTYAVHLDPACLTQPEVCARGENMDSSRVLWRREYGNFPGVWRGNGDVRGPFQRQRVGQRVGGGVNHLGGWGQRGRAWVLVARV